MQVIEIEDTLANKVSEAAKAENKSLSEFVSLTLEEKLEKKRRGRMDDEKIRRFAESYSTFPQRAEEWELWQNEQVWENE